ncbi:MAG TPA: hypothetical protein VGX25_15075 [Actinophytocola sp.]|uniref:hypothetical protein n=1 Tax=Actinophytocola sp. TaxID=1872138 RepID=UPI002DDD9D50|nr:hypothetical protein [Actinophytocola sp.]HEV2780710.1 hypothetical protein [Actinophytocola sp.]
MYLTDEIDEDATRRRLDEITTAGLQALDEHAARSAEIDGQFREALARQQAEARAMDQLVADAQAKQEGDRATAEPPSPWARRDTKPTVMSLGGEEFTEQAATAPVGLPVPAAALPVPLPPEPPPMPPAVAEDRTHLLSLGYAGEDDSPREQPPPAPPPAPPVTPTSSPRRPSRSC